MKLKSLCLVIAALTAPNWAAAESELSQKMLPAELVTKAKKAVDKGLRFLRSKQAKDGSYGKHVGLTGMTLMAFGNSHRKYRYDDGPFIQRAADWMAKQARADGAVTGEAVEVEDED